MPKIFISYGRDESHGQHLATEAQQQLQAAGFEVFRDVIGLKPGDVWYSKLEFELETSDLVVLVISEKVRKSEWVHNEISMAKEIGLPIIPLIAEQVRMPLWLRHLQSLDFSAQADWELLFAAISGHIPLLLQDDVIPVVSKSVGSGIPTAKLAVSTPPIYTGTGNKPYAPSWASHSGEDEYGQYADLQVKQVTQRFRLIHPGTFQMGSPESEKGRESGEAKETLHQVTLSQAFWLADTACTQALWSAVMSNNPSRFNDNENNPVERVSWDDIQEFNRVLSLLNSGLSPSLPTEAQWEYACRAGTTSPFSFGETITPEQINYNGNYPYVNGKKGVYRKKTVPVKSLAVNPWGLYEMHGNVLEWCQDVYQKDLGGQACTDPLRQAEGGVNRVLRGGSLGSHGRGCRSAIRGRGLADNRSLLIGFRLSLVN